ncbi:hypothetical protein [Alkalicoccobacillus porphyridii]|uniref:DUF3221 domain-containing protein n=1 Tax=Alkalicoccobacillus porphyridii TaxID=2597270 RepID=A0A554A2M2_9BACI|nr:hypothetical protein [Alkalicoccobacillus porphyridii]TSB47941.1 hypothetical protein FN960_05395 [Alkalicoccobacillus porphyridii]
MYKLLLLMIPFSFIMIGCGNGTAEEPAEDVENEYSYEGTITEIGEADHTPGTRITVESSNENEEYSTVIFPISSIEDTLERDLVVNDNVTVYHDGSMIEESLPPVQHAVTRIEINNE